jgi:hypothetical protein
MHLKSHQKVLDLLMADFRNTLLSTDEHRHMVTLNEEIYPDFVKELYRPKSMDKNAHFNEVRKVTIINQRNTSGKDEVKNPQLWMPPRSVLLQVAKLNNLHNTYLSTVGQPEALLPDFLGSGCLRKSEKGVIEYDFGEDAQVNDILSTIQRSTKRQNEDGTPKKGQGRKKFFVEPTLTSTPVTQICNTIFIQVTGKSRHMMLVMTAVHPYSFSYDSGSFSYLSPLNRSPPIS